MVSYTHFSEFFKNLKILHHMKKFRHKNVHAWKGYYIKSNKKLNLFIFSLKFLTIVSSCSYVHHLKSIILKLLPKSDTNFIK